VAQSNGTEIWVKDLNGGNKALGLFNRSSEPKQIDLDWKNAGLTGKRTLRDLWTHKDVGSFEEKYSAQIPAHGVLLLLAK
jgi:alpha-galactosidase